MRQTRRAFRNGTKFASERVWSQTTRKACVCCRRERLDGETFSLSGQCADCSELNMIAAMLGQRVSEHWVEGPSGERINEHARLVSEVGN